MTLIAGIVCKDSIVFATDSEESGTVRKATVEKIKRVPESGAAGLLGHDPKKYCCVVVCGAGNGTLCDYAMQRVTDEVRETTNQSEAIAKVQEVLSDIFKDHVPPLQQIDADPNFELLIGIKAPKDYMPVLYSTQGITAVRRDKYFCSGSGALTDYILDQIYLGQMTTEDGIAAALHMLQVAKKYVAGVGGQSHVVVLKNDGTIEDKPSWEVSAEENIATEFGELTGILLLSLMRTRSGTEQVFSQLLREFGKQVRKLRKKKKKSDSFWDEFLRNLESSKDK